MKKILFILCLLGIVGVVVMWLLHAYRDDPSMPKLTFSSERSSGFKRMVPGHDPTKNAVKFECWHFVNTDKYYFRTYSELASRSILIYSFENEDARNQSRLLWNTLLERTGEHTSNAGAISSVYTLLITYTDGTVAHVILRLHTDKLGLAVAAEAKIGESLLPINVKALNSLVNYVKKK